MEDKSCECGDILVCILSLRGSRSKAFRIQFKRTAYAASGHDHVIMITRNRSIWDLTQLVNEFPYDKSNCIMLGGQRRRCIYKDMNDCALIWDSGDEVEEKMVLASCLVPWVTLVRLWDAVKVQLPPFPFSLYRSTAPPIQKAVPC